MGNGLALFDAKWAVEQRIRQRRLSGVHREP